MGWGLRGLLAAALASVGFGAASHVIDAIPDYGDLGFSIGRRGKSRNHGSTPGGRAHRRWKRARASGINPRVRHG